MAQQANITVFDGAATPVTHTLVALGLSTEGKKVKAFWGERATGVPLEAQIRLTLESEPLPSGIVKTTATVEVPVMESIAGQNAAGYTAAPKVAYIDKYVSISYRHPRSTITNQRLARQILTNLLGNVSTSVAAATSGALPDAFDMAVMPS